MRVPDFKIFGDPGRSRRKPLWKKADPPSYKLVQQLQKQWEKREKTKASAEGKKLLCGSLKRMLQGGRGGGGAQRLLGKNQVCFREKGPLHSGQIVGKVV